MCTKKLAKSIPWNRFLGSINIYKFGLYIGKIFGLENGINSNKVTDNAQLLSFYLSSQTQRPNP